MYSFLENAFILDNIRFFLRFYTPQNEVYGGYTGFTLFVRPSVRPSVGRCPDDNSHSFQWI